MPNVRRKSPLPRNGAYDFERDLPGVWVGNFDGNPMWEVSGVTGATPVWHDVMAYLHRQVASQAPGPPAGVPRQAVSYRPAFASPRREWLIGGTESTVITVLDNSLMRWRSRPFRCAAMRCCR